MTTTERKPVSDLAPGDVIVANAGAKSETRYKVIVVEPLTNPKKLRVVLTLKGATFISEKYKNETFNVLKHDTDQLPAI